MRFEVPVRTSSHYRPELDGLRAIAIALVLLFHAGARGFRGGFVGVDVFFVLSGYLITGLICREGAEGRFSLRGFYERRIRRIFPALFAMLGPATAAAALLLFPTDFERYAKSLIATALFSSNFEFWREAGYFDAASASKPLLHLWSIAVEEQFYLLFPALLLLAGVRSRGRLVAAVSVLFALSFAFSVWAAGADPVAGFYLLPSRVWELMSGALVALVPMPRLPRLAGEGMSAGGLGLIAWSAAHYHPAMPFPGSAALMPCLGAALVIAGTRSAPGARRMLAARPLTALGLISYSLYLWHWPVLVFARRVVGGELDGLQTLACIALAILLAAASYRFVETPFRSRRAAGWRPLVLGAGSAVGLTALCGAAIAADRGAPERWRPEIRRILAEERNHEPRMDICFGLTAGDVRSGRLCRIGSTAAPVPSFLLWGDSHADAILPAIHKLARDGGRSGLFAGSAACPPLLGFSRSDQRNCKPFNDQALKVALRPNIKTVILSARWAKSANDPFSPAHSNIVTSDGEGRSVNRAAMQAIFSRSLERTVRRLAEAGKRVVIVGPVPEAAFSVPREMAELRLSGQRATPWVAVPDFYRMEGFVLNAFERMQRDYGAVVLHPERVLCATGRCALALRGRPLYRDEHHLSVFGALQLTPVLAGAFPPDHFVGD